MKLFAITKRRKPTRMKNKKKTRKNKKNRKKSDAIKYNKLSKVQCNDTGTDCIWDDKVTVFD